MMLSLSSSKTGTERKRPAATSARICRPTVISSCLRGLGSVRLTRSVSPMPRREELLEGHARLDDAVGRHARPRSRPGAAARRARAAAKRRLASITLRGCGVLQADHVAVEAQIVEQRAVLAAPTPPWRPTSSSGWRALISGSTLPQLTPTRMAQSLLARHLGQEAHLLAHRLLALVVVQVAGVVADLVHVRAPRARPGGSSPAGRRPGWPWSGAGSRPAHRRPRRCRRPRAPRPAPAARIASACSTVASMSWVRVAHMLCTTTGAPPPMVTVPTFTARVGLRGRIDRS